MSQVYPPTVRAAAVAYLVLTLGHLTAQLVGADRVTAPSQWLLMPALAAVLWTATAATGRSRRVRVVLLALGFSWLGDSVPALLSGDSRFLGMVGLFLCAQVTYAFAFWPDRQRSVLRRPAVTGYLVAFGMLVLACAPGADRLFGPVLGYGGCLTLMAVLATGVDRLAGVGGALFFVSDSLIALDAFTGWYHPPVAGLWVMATYTVGQALLMAGVLRRELADRAVTAGASRAG